MQAIEFITKTKKGKLIEIPKEFAKDVSGEIRVIILMTNKKKQVKSQQKSFKALKLKIKGFKFNRDEIYEE